MTATPHTAAELADALRQPPARWTPVVKGLLEEQGELCERLEDLGREQSTHVAAGETDRLMDVLTRRQQVLDRVMAINATLESFRSRRDALMSGLIPVERAAIQARIDRVAESVDRIRRRDDDDRRALEGQRNAVADELASISRLRGAAAAYAGASGQQRPRFHDRRG